MQLARASENEFKWSGISLFPKVLQMADSESFLVTVPGEWDLEHYAIEKRKFPSVQDYIRELVRRDIEQYEKEVEALKSKK